MMCRLELEEMNRRVDNQPTLFQKQSQISAKMNMEKKYAQVLKRQVQRLVNYFREINSVTGYRGG